VERFTLDSFGSGPLVGSCVRGNRPSASINNCEFLDCETVSLSRSRASLSWGLETSGM
jgi:hypothetical protein